MMAISSTEDNTIYNYCFYDKLDASDKTIPGVISLSDEEEEVYFYHKEIDCQTYTAAGQSVIRDTIIDYVWFSALELYGFPTQPSNYDSVRLYPRYLLGIDSITHYSANKKYYYVDSRGREYKKSWYANKWAENLAKFIDEVRKSTGAQKVNLVCHSMGGVVARVALAGYNCKYKVDKLLTLGTPHKTYNIEDFEEVWSLLNKIFGSMEEWMENGELAELGVRPFQGKEPLFTDLKYNSKHDKVGTFHQLLERIEEEKYVFSFVEISTIAGCRRGPITNNSLLPNSDGFVPLANATLDFAEYKPIIFASHSMGGITSFDNERKYELSLPSATFSSEFTKRWIYDDTRVLYRGDPEDISAAFSFVGNPETGYLSRSIRVNILGIDSYEGILSLQVQTVVSPDIGMDNEATGTPAKGYDVQTIIDNNRDLSILRGAPVYMKTHELDNQMIDNTDTYYSRIWLYDMNGMISGNFYQHEHRFETHLWENVPEPYVSINYTILQAFDNNTNTISWETNDYAVHTTLQYLDLAGNTVILLNEDGQSSSYLWENIPPMSAKGGWTETKFVNFTVVYNLDDYGSKISTTRQLPVNTPNWSPVNLATLSSDEISISLEWDVKYEAQNILLYRNGSLIVTLGGGVTSFEDENFVRGEINHYEVKAKYGELISINDDESNILDVYGIPANTPKPYPLANFNENKTELNVKWIDNSDVETGYVLSVIPNGGTTTNYRITTIADTLSYQVPIPTVAGEGDLYIAAVGQNNIVSNRRIHYSYCVCDGLPFSSVNPFPITHKKGNLSYNNGKYFISSIRQYSTVFDVLSIEEFDGNSKEVIFSEYCNSVQEENIVASPNQDVVIYAEKNAEDFLNVLYENELGNWQKTTVAIDGFIDWDQSVETIKLHSLIVKDGIYYLLISREVLNTWSMSTFGNKLAILKITNTSGQFAIQTSRELLSSTLADRVYYEGSLKLLSDGRIGVTYNSQEYPYDDNYTGLVIKTFDANMGDEKQIISPVVTSNHETADFDIISDKAKVLLSRSTSDANIIKLKTFNFNVANSVWSPADSNIVDSRLVSSGEYLGNPSVIYSNNGLFLSWTYNNSSYQGIVNYKTVNSSGVLSANKTALSLNKNITDYAIQNQDGLIKIIAQYLDEEITTGTYMLSEISPSYNEIALNLNNTFYGYSDETINLTAEDIFTGEPITNAAVTVTNNADFSYSGVTDATGSISIPYYTESDNDMVVTVDKEYYQKKVIQENVTIHNMNVSQPSELPVLTTKALNFKVTVSTGGLPKANEIPLSGAIITLQSTDISFTGITNLSGSVSCTKKTSYTTPISVTITKDRYRTYEAEIYPYMWSTTNEALGENNQTHMVRKPATNILGIIYSDGDSIVYGYSNDLGKIWYLQKIGKGTMPTMVRRSNGITALWKNGQMLEYATMSSPWSPVDTVISPAYSVSEPNLFKHPDPANDSLFACVIESRQVQTCGDYILATWYDVLVESMTSEVIVPYTGDEDDNSVIPNKQPVVGKYLASNKYYNMISFISSNNQLITKLQNLMYPNYKIPFVVSNDNQIVSNSSIDVYGNTTSFTWSADNLSSSEIWRRKLVDGNFSDAERVDNITGFNSNPKVKDNFLYGFVNDAKRIVTTPNISDENATLVIEEAEDSLFNFDFVVKKTLIDADAFFVLSEGSNGNYRIKTMRVNYSGIAQPRIISDPTDTIVENIFSSPIYDYVSGRPFVERMTYDAIALDTVLNYDVRLVVSQTNPVRPQVLMFDTTVIDVIYGTPNTVDTLQYTVPKELYTDGEFMITLDRLRGNPNRTAQIAIYEYETDSAEGTIADDDKIKKLIFKPQMPNQQFEYYLASGLEFGNELIKFSLAEQGEVTLNLFDVSGRCIGDLASGAFNSGVHYANLPKGLSSGVYFVKMEAGGQTFIEKIVRIK